MKTRSSSRHNLNQKNASGKKRDSPEPHDDDDEENSTSENITTTPTRTRKRTKLMIAQYESDNESDNDDEESQSSSSSIEVDESALLNLTDIFHIIIENELLEQYYPGALIALSLTRKDFYDCVFKHLVSGGAISQDKPEHLLNALRVRFSKASKTCLFCNENRAQLLPQFGFYVHTSKCKEAIHRHMINVYYPLKKGNNPCFSKEQLLTALPHATLTGNSKYSGKYEFNVVWENDDGFLPRNQTLEGFLAGDISDREIKQKTEAIKAEREAEVRRKQEKRMEADRKIPICYLKFTQIYLSSSSQALGYVADRDITEHVVWPDRWRVDKFVPIIVRGSETILEELGIDGLHYHKYDLWIGCETSTYD